MSIHMLHHRINDLEQQLAKRNEEKAQFEHLRMELEQRVRSESESRQIARNLRAELDHYMLERQENSFKFDRMSNDLKQCHNQLNFARTKIDEYKFESEKYVTNEKQYFREIDDLKTQIKSLMDSNSRETSNAIHFKTKYDELVLNNKRNYDEIMYLNRDLKSLDENYSKVLKEKDALSFQLQEKYSIINNLKKELEKISANEEFDRKAKEKIQLQYQRALDSQKISAEKIDDLMKENQHLRHKERDMQSNISKLQNLSKSFSSMEHDLNIKLNKLEQELEQKVSQNNGLTNSIDTYKNDLDRLCRKEIDYQDEISHLKQELHQRYMHENFTSTSFEHYRKECDKLTEQQAEYVNKISYLQKELANKNNSSFENKREDEKRQINMLERELSEIYERERNLLNSNEILENRLSQQKMEITLLQNKLKENECTNRMNEKRLLKDYCANCEKNSGFDRQVYVELEVLRKENEALKNELFSDENLKSDNKLDLQKLIKKDNENSKVINNLLTENRSLRDNKASANSDLKVKCEKLTVENSDLQKKIKTFETINKSLVEVNNSNSSQSSENEIAGLKLRVEFYKKKVDKMMNDMEANKKAKETDNVQILRSRVEELFNENKKLKSSNVEMDNQQLLFSQRECEWISNEKRLKAKLESLKAENENLLKREKQLKNQHTNLRNEIDDLQSSLADAKAELFTIEEGKREKERNKERENIIGSNSDDVAVVAAEWEFSNSNQKSGSIADCVKATVQNKLNSEEYVYDETYQMYYHKSSGYYYDSTRELYYYPETGTYYAYDKTKNEYNVHSVVDNTNMEDFVVVSSADEVSLPNIITRDAILVKELGKDESDVNITEKEDVQKKRKLNLQDDDEQANKWPLYIRAMVISSDCLDIGRLKVIGSDGALIGSGENCSIKLSELDQKHAEILYDKRLRRFTICCEVFNDIEFSINGVSIGELGKEPILISHKDRLLLNKTCFELHVHAGPNTCDDCEPGVVLSKLKNQEAANVSKYEVKNTEEARKENVLEMKRKFGLTGQNNNSQKQDERYANRAEERRKTVGSDNPHVKETVESASSEKHISNENVGHKMLQKMGWSAGEGLGQNSKGTTEPVSVQMRSKDTVGLGSSLSNMKAIDSGGRTEASEKWLKAKERFDKITDKENGKDKDVEVKVEKKEDKCFIKGETILPS